MEITSLVYFLGFLKAFDTVDHKTLLKKLDFYGIKGVTYNWFEDFLRERKQYVTYNAITSDTEVIKCGVPQGSILGPLLFFFTLYRWFSHGVKCVSQYCLLTIPISLSQEKA